MTNVAGGNFLIPDGTFLVELAIFILLAAALFKFAIKPLRAGLSLRQQELRKQLEDNKAANQRLESAEAEFAKAIAEARAEAGKIREEANRQRTQTIEGAKDEARKAAAAVAKQAEERLELQYRQVAAVLRRDIGKLAVELAGRIVGESLADEELQRRVIDRFLAELETGDAAATRESVS
jgi:F-type H+-transporting ATPase subunit b